jgi:hypothetical protein
MLQVRWHYESAAIHPAHGCHKQPHFSCPGGQRVAGLKVAYNHSDGRLLRFGCSGRPHQFAAE